MDQYKITDELRQDELIELARGSRKQSWSEYSDVYDIAARVLFGFEAAAKTIYKYEPTFIPGILRTEEYAIALLRAVGHTDHEVERMVRGRLERQELLDKGSPPELQFIIGEAAISRAVGGRVVMFRQLERLKDLAARPRISLQILPFEVGAHPRMGEAFTILEFRDENLDDLVCLENAGRESVSREDPDFTAAYLRDFVTLQSWLSPTATSPRRSTRSQQCDWHLGTGSLTRCVKRPSKQMAQAKSVPRRLVSDSGSEVGAASCARVR
jgi:hypothetical protein